jgi:CheY-like chemotaxis protein
LTIESFRSALDGSVAADRLELPAGNYTVIAVSDTGHGMEHSTRERIFEPFFTTKGPQTGTGLGLATVLGIVQQSGGNVWVYSEPDRGTTFKLYFPCTDEPTEELVSPPPAAVLPRTGTVLVAEDDEQVRHMVERVLERAGFDVVVAVDALEALTLAAKQEKIDLLLTDVVMPKMSGTTLAGKLWASRPNLPVLFTSGYTENTIFSQESVDRDVHFLPKPITPERLLAAIGEVLQRRR